MRQRGVGPSGPGGRSRWARREIERTSLLTWSQASTMEFPWFREKDGRKKFV